jgi:glycosyltransferase involved in cell wall biosynthesis
MPSVSAIVPTRERPELAAEAVTSIVKQTRPPDEIIVADDGEGSTGAALAGRFGVRVVNAGGQGPAVARNRAAEIAQGDWLAFCDDDDTWFPARLATQLAATNDDTVLVFADARRNDGASEWADRHPTGGDVFDALLLDNWIPTSTVLLRRDIFQRAGGFETRFCPAEDYRLWLRVAKLGKFVMIREPLAAYRQHEHQLQRDAARMFGVTADAIDDALCEDGRRAAQIPGLDARLSDLRFVQGRELMRRGQPREARQAYRRAWRYQPARWPAYLYWLASYLNI